MTTTLDSQKAYDISKMTPEAQAVLIPILIALFQRIPDMTAINNDDKDWQ